MLKKELSSIVICLFCMAYFTNSYGETFHIKQGNLYVNNQLIESEDTIIYKESAILFPLRTILESLGANVVWDQKTEDIYVEYKNKNYICSFEQLNPDYYKKYFFIKNVETNQYIYLNPMGMSGAFEMINDRTYLYRDTAERLLKALGCSVEIDEENHVVRISN